MNSARIFAVALCLLANQAAAQTLVLVSDLNGRYGSTEYSPRVAVAAESIVKRRPDVVISVGDMVAGQRKPLLEAPQLDQMWRGFNQVFADPLAAAGIPLVVTPGNHDGSAFPDFGLERQHFEQQWSGRQGGLELLPGSQWPRRYAARVEGVLLLSFDGTLPGSLPDSERGFVEDMLEQYAEPDGKTIVFSHLPMWPLARGREKEILNDRRLLDLLHRHGVDVYASGHHHFHYAGMDDHGMIHLAVGALGGNVRQSTSGGVRQPHSYASIDFDRGTPEIRSYAAPDFHGTIDQSTLPSSIEGPLGRLQKIEAAAY